MAERRFDAAVTVTDIDTLKALGDSSSPLRVDGGLYFVTNTGQGFPRWAQYLADADSPEIVGRIIEPDDGVGRFILTEIGSGSGGLAIISESEPIGELGGLWFNPASKVLRIYDGLVWESLTVDDGQY